MSLGSLPARVPRYSTAAQLVPDPADTGVLCKASDTTVTRRLITYNHLPGDSQEAKQPSSQAKGTASSRNAYLDSLHSPALPALYI